jgi:hypothetical protein
MAALAIGGEQYDGFWNQKGVYIKDPPGSSIIQYRMDFGFAYRLADNVQSSISLPLIWNHNEYIHTNSNTYGAGDTSLGFKYEFFDKIRCVWKVRNWQDLLPAIYLGADFLIPTGISPYSDVKSSFDTTGLGFYRMDAVLLLEKTISSFSASAQVSLGDYLERKVNRFLDNYVEPYDKKLGRRFGMAYSIGYSYMLESMSTMTLILAYAYLKEGEGRVNNNADPTVAFSRNILSLGLSYATASREIIYKLKFNHTIKAAGWGENFPATDIITLEANYVFR